MYVQRNTEARTRNHFCRGKAISITGMCVCNLIYPAHNAHAPYYIVICGLSYIFPRPMNGTVFGKKKLINMKSVL